LLEQELHITGSDDPDARFILDAVVKGTEILPEALQPWSYIADELAKLALKKNFSKNDNSYKAQYLRIMRWCVEGKRDESKPFGEDWKGLKDDKLSKEYLPAAEDHSKCVKCGKSAELKCTGCIVKTGDKVTLATFYCSRECQKKHWPHHKSDCKEHKEIMRAMSIFQPIFEHIILLIMPVVGGKTTVKEQNGIWMIEKECDEVLNKDDTQWETFVKKRAPNPDVAKAVLMTMQSWRLVTLESAKFLVELLLTRKSTLCYHLPDHKLILIPSCLQKPLSC
jgi:MYND finger.